MRKQIVLSAATIFILTACAVVNGQNHTITGVILDGNSPVSGVTVTVFVNRKAYNSDPSKGDGSYTVSFPETDVVRIQYVPTGSAYYATEIERASGRRNHQVSMGLRSTSTELSTAEATRFYDQVIESMKLDIENGVPSEQSRAKYSSMIDKVRIDANSVDSWSGYNSLQSQHSFARRLYGLPPGLLRDKDGKALEPPMTAWEEPKSKPLSRPN